MAAVAVFGALLPALLGERGAAARRGRPARGRGGADGLRVGDHRLRRRGGRPSTTHHELEPNVYLPCRDGWVIMVAFAEPHWHSLVDLMGSPEWAFEPEYATAQSRASITGPCTRTSPSGRGRKWARTSSRGPGARAAVLLLGGAGPDAVQRAGGRDRFVTKAHRVVVPADPILVDGRRRPRPASRLRTSGAAAPGAGCIIERSG